MECSVSKIVAFSVASKEQGEQALGQLEDVVGVEDVAMVFKNNKGKVKIQQTSDATVGKSAVRGALLFGVASIFVGPLVGMAATGAAAGGAFGALRDKGVSDQLMKLAGAQLEAGGAAVFVLADDDTAGHIAEQVRAVAGDVEVGEFSADAQKLVREELKLDA
jgi:uncharacterized membrane protein